MITGVPVCKNFGKDAPGTARASAHPRQFLQRAQLVVGLLAEQLRPVRVGDLGHVDIPMGIDRDAVRGNELPGASPSGCVPSRANTSPCADRSETRGPRFGTPAVSVATVSGPNSPTMTSEDLPRVI